MIKTLTLILVVWNPANDTESEVVYDTFEYNECFKKEKEINKINSIININMKENGLELVATYCD
jgi:hypothetical protein